MEVKRPIIAEVLLQLNASEGDRLLSPTEIKSDAEDATNFIDGTTVAICVVVKYRSNAAACNFRPLLILIFMRSLFLVLM